MVVVIRTGGRGISLNILCGQCGTIIILSENDYKFNILVLLIYQLTDVANKYFCTMFLAFIHVLYLYHSVNPIVADV